MAWSQAPVLPPTVLLKHTVEPLSLSSFIYKMKRLETQEWASKEPVRDGAAFPSSLPNFPLASVSLFRAELMYL